MKRGLTILFGALAIASTAHADDLPKLSERINEVRGGIMVGGVAIDVGDRVSQGVAYGVSLAGSFFAVMDDGLVLAMSVDLFDGGGGTNGFWARSGGDIGAGLVADSADGGTLIWVGYHGMFDTLELDPDSIDVGYYEHGIVLKLRGDFGAFGVEGSVAGLLGTGWNFSLGVRSALSSGMSLGVMATLHTVGTGDENEMATDPGSRADWGRDMLLVNTFIAFH